MDGRIVSVGSVNLDHVIRVPTIVRPGETMLARSLAVSPGGKSFNQAAAARLLGGDVELVASVADDAAGTVIRDDLDNLGIASDRLVNSQDAATGLAFINVDDDGENAIVVVSGANATLTMTDGMAGAIADADIVMLALEVPIETVAACARRGAASGGRVILNLSPYQPVPRELLDDCFLIIVNEHELLHLLPGRTPPEAGADWSRSQLASDLAGIGIGRAVVTLGPRGAVVLEPDQVTHIVAPRVQAADTTGSGDAFAGALGYGLSIGLDLAEAAQLGARVGAYAAMRPGARPSYPTRLELDEWLAERDTLIV